MLKLFSNACNISLAIIFTALSNQAIAQESYWLDSYTGGGIPRKVSTTRSKKSGHTFVKVKSTVARSPTIFKLLSISSGKPVTLRADTDFIIAIDGFSNPRSSDFVNKVKTKKAFEITVRRLVNGKLPKYTQQKMLVVTRLALENATAQQATFESLINTRYESATNELRKLTLYQDSHLLPIAKKFSNITQFARKLTSLEKKRFLAGMEYVQDRRKTIRKVITKTKIDEAAYAAKNKAKIKLRSNDAIIDFYFEHLSNLDSRLKMINDWDNVTADRNELTEMIENFQRSLKQEEEQRRQAFERDLAELATVVKQTNENMQLQLEALAVQIAIQQAEVDEYNQSVDQYNAEIEEQNAIANAAYYESASYDGGWSHWNTSRLMFNKGYKYNPDHASVYGR